MGQLLLRVLVGSDLRAWLCFSLLADLNRLVYWLP